MKWFNGGGHLVPCRLRAQDTDIESVSANHVCGSTYLPMISEGGVL
ncbi:MAG: hypothetical protein RL594_1168 [Bacteroidota bacterium]|jgi:hypothetical protein